ncbi:unnamed protein product [Cladocopium goreaui]|uniref:ADP-ribosylation factor n=1 Tax=Cladocopium goreaui TaxID=2562237 RepID=A0A9P1C5F6_9DINO|nr:unnamed protein product [Cladocopium goreaui]
MGAWFSRNDRRSRRLLMIGPAYAGKTTLLYHFKLGEHVQAIPTVGYNVEAVRFQNTTFTVFDIAGKDRIMRLGNIYADRSADGLIFVVDSSTSSQEATEQLHRGILQWNTKKVLLILANKQDLEGAMDVDQLSLALKLSELPGDWTYHVQKTSGLTGQGFHEVAPPPLLMQHLVQLGEALAKFAKVAKFKADWSMSHGPFANGSTHCHHSSARSYWVSTAKIWSSRLFTHRSLAPLIFFLAGSSCGSGLLQRGAGVPTTRVVSISATSFPTFGSRLPLSRHCIPWADCLRRSSLSTKAAGCQSNRIAESIMAQAQGWGCTFSLHLMPLWPQELPSPCDPFF